MTFYQLKPRMPGGTWLAVILMIAGIVMTALSLLKTRSMPLSISGCIIIILGLALLTVTIIATRRSTVSVTFDEEGYTVDGPNGEFCGAWIDVTDVSVSRKTAKIALLHGPRRRTIIAHPARTMDDEFMRIREEIRNHLEALDAEEGWS